MKKTIYKRKLSISISENSYYALKQLTYANNTTPSAYLDKLIIQDYQANLEALQAKQISLEQVKRAIDTAKCDMNQGCTLEELLARHQNGISSSGSIKNDS